MTLGVNERGHVGLMGAWWILVPVLAWMYVLLARREEREAITELGDSYLRYMDKVPASVPRWSRPKEVGGNHG